MYWNSLVRLCILVVFDEFNIKICVNVLLVVKEKKIERDGLEC